MARNIAALLGLLALVACSQDEASREPARPAWDMKLLRTNYPARDTAVGFVFRDRFWLSNGWAHGLFFRDLWRSDDGLSWTLVDPDTPYDRYSSIVEFRGRLYAVNRSVWVSDDGEEWSRILETTPFADRRPEGGLFVVGDRLVFIGPRSVYASADGVTWEALADPAPYGPRFGYASLYFKGRLWVLSGHNEEPNDPPEGRNTGWTSFADVWWSDDGRNWNRAEAPWGPRTWLSAIVHRQRAYMISGLDNIAGRNLDETWVSDDGLSWSLLEVEKNFGPPRHWPVMWSHQDRLLLATGNAWPVVNDVWELRETP